ncbi:methyltransferase domain-containing protein [uncultured Desulfobulbus sp.]|uniref:methyltransferase domain-containing protein n=1 Tax=uncultured Desulfobulbus sp. TaxID=239745 RepID=UPI0029C9A135|nr:methyltransferase domain-containing protein [uncultured Desulfobulbus sp.]
MNEKVYLYQIAYSEETLKGVEPGYLILNNLENSRPDWREYWPIRQHLLAHDLNEDAFFGFLSPKFPNKTLLTYEQTKQLVMSAADRADVILFSPQPDMGSFFLNVFEQGEIFDPGFINAFEAFLEQVGHRVKLNNLVMDSRNIVFSNFFVARPAFWKAWLEICEKFFVLCEGPASDLQRMLIQSTSYEAGVQRKVFILERIASYLLATQPSWRVVASNPFQFAWSGPATRFREFPDEAVISDALKIAFREQRYSEYIQVYSRLRQRCFGQNSVVSSTNGSFVAITGQNKTNQFCGKSVEDGCLRQVVKNYKIVTDIPTMSKEYQFGGDSAANKFIIGHLFPNEITPKIVLDIGMGVGSLGMLINQSPQLRRWIVDGIDGFNETCCNVSLFNKGIYRNVWHGMAQDLSLERLITYDVLCLFDVIEHLSPEAATNLLRTLLSSLGDHSLLVISTPLWFYPQYHQKDGDLEEHLIGISIQSMMDMKPIMYCIGNSSLVGNFVYSKKSILYIDNFNPITDKSFSIDKGTEQVLSLGLHIDNKVYIV